MRLLSIQLFALVALSCMSGNVYAYAFGFSNHTKKTLVIRTGIIGHPHYYYNIVRPNKRVEFEFWGSLSGHCMSGIDWAEYNPNIKLTKAQTQGSVETDNGGLDIQQHYRNAGWTMVDRFFGWVPYHYNPVEIVFLPDEVYEETVKHAAGIGSGFDTFLCYAVILTKILNKGECPSILADIIDWIGGLIARSACRSREFMIFADKQGNPVFTTTLK